MSEIWVTVWSEWILFYVVASLLNICNFTSMFSWHLHSIRLVPRSIVQSTGGRRGRLHKDAGSQVSEVAFKILPSYTIIELATSNQSRWQC